MKEREKNNEGEDVCNRGGAVALVTVRQLRGLKRYKSMFLFLKT